MASTPLFDLSEIDLDQVAIDAAEVGRLNHQAGAMRQLDHIVWYDLDRRSMLGVKKVTGDEFWVPLHIPGRPLMPGVLMIEAGAQVCSVYFQRRVDKHAFLGFTRCGDTVFRGQVVPGDTLYLLCKDLAFNPRRIIGAVQGVVNGTVIFESKISGMAV